MIHYYYLYDGIKKVMTKAPVCQLTCLTNLPETIKLWLLIIYLYENAEKRRVRNQPHVQRLPEAEKEA
jgi:hypothetical protein